MNQICIIPSNLQFRYYNLNRSANRNEIQVSSLSRALSDVWTSLRARQLSNDGDGVVARSGGRAAASTTIIAKGPKCLGWVPRRLTEGLTSNLCSCANWESRGNAWVARVSHCSMGKTTGGCSCRCWSSHGNPVV